MSYKLFIDMIETQKLLSETGGLRKCRISFLLDMRREPSSPVWLKKCRIRFKAYTT